MAFGGKIQANYDELNNIANQFMQEASAASDLTNKIQNLVSDLEGGGWIGRGAENFYAEMYDLVFPGLERLSQALEQAGQATKKVADIISQAEQDASGQFKF